MNQETNDFLMENLNDAHHIFKCIIGEMQQKGIPFEYELIKEKEMNSYEIVSNLLVKMDSEVYEYNYLIDNNQEFFNDKYSFYLKYISLYIVSFIFIKMYHEIFTTEKFNELWHYIVGLFLGSTFVGLLNKDINEYQSNTKEKRDLINRLKTLKEEHMENHDKAVNEIDYIFALNDNLWDELENSKKLVKNK